MTPSLTGELKWWQSGIIYQIYPRSFQDDSGDGVGDLRGITRRLPYVASLGVKAVWLSPIFRSPMRDFGYDVADYCDIDPLFGTLEDFDAFVAEAHRLNLKVMLDYVPNHSSSDHAWFQEALQGRGSAKRDWYVWRDPAEGGGLPNNWKSFFGGPAWTLDEASGQYYLHQFLPSQPDLNWRNPAVREAMFDALRFWMRRGVDGFRVDVIWLLAEDDRYLDEPENPDWQPGQPEHWSLLHPYTQDQPETHEYIREMRAVLDEFDDRMMVGEIYLPVEQLLPYSGTEDARMVHLPFNFHLILMPWQAQEVRRFADSYDAASLAAGAWPNWVLGNHDQHRFRSRLGDAQYRVAQTLLLTLRGTPTVYYGDEIGMHDVEIPADRIVDPAALQQPDSPEAGRDPERTPMQWDASVNAGFSADGTTPWLPIADDFATLNVAVQEGDPASDLNYFRALTRLRQEHPALIGGTYRSVDAPDDVFAFIRQDDSGTLTVLLNFGAQTHDLGDLARGQTLLSSLGDQPASSAALRPNEARILRG
ncbi:MULTISPECIES: alpha-amylase family glycosyl hydrolase [unclassified Deinococcus]|uniref:alpha-amylase family glycosyl hydrolase n=1 Tax=unclassified Deinococcus TaxID=2623546 RepID=UPI001C2FF818|nr:MULTISPECIES: alpha-amylase family glycosyl hydrolase [unclassified Deinococcus]MDK2010877.1 alpha-amylase family glycosyl hydrolase [Deinococcus sp. 43]